jgi:hypothetical protein
MAQEKDLVLIYFEDKPLTFARIETILANSKPNWYHVQLLMLQIPLQLVTWILRDAYINGAEFTMNGKRMRIEKVVVPEDTPAQAQEEKVPAKKKPSKDSSSAKVISLSDLKKK